MLVYENIKHLPAKERQDFIWDKIIYANPIKAKETLEELDQYKPLVTYDNLEEIAQDQAARAARRPGAAAARAEHRRDGGAVVQVRLRAGRGGGPDPGSVPRSGLVVEGLSFHVGSQSTNFENYVQALNMAAAVMRRGARRAGTRSRSSTSAAASRCPTTGTCSRSASWPGRSTPRSTGSSRRTSRSSPSRAASWWPRRRPSVARVIGKAVRDGKTCYYIDDGVYHTFSGIIFDHCQYHVKAFKKGDDRDLRGLRPDLRRPGHHLAGRGAARAGDRRPGLHREHRRLQQRLVDLVQRLPAGEGRAREPVGPGLGAPVSSAGPTTRRCFAVAPLTARSGIERSKVTSRPPCARASPSR